MTEDPLSIYIVVSSDVGVKNGPSCPRESDMASVSVVFIIFSVLWKVQNYVCFYILTSMRKHFVASCFINKIKQYISAQIQ